MKPPLGIFHFFTLPLEISGKTKLNPWIFHKIVLYPLEVPRLKTRDPGNSTLFFHDQPWKFSFPFIQPLETLHAISSIPLEIPYPQPTPPFPPVWISPGISNLAS